MSNNAQALPQLPRFPDDRPPEFSSESQPQPRQRLGLHVGLFIVTLITATLAGAKFYASFVSGLGQTPIALDWRLIAGGLWYSGTFLAILGAHEAGHYLYCRRYGIEASLPYFIPLPPNVFMSGTLGAVIRIRDSFRTRTELFDVGIAGPIGGLVVLVPALFVGFTLSTVVAEPPPHPGDLFFGEPLLFQWAARLVLGDLREGTIINVHPVVWGCWFGMIATALNLLPVGQFDGGHIVYAVFGQRVARNVSLVTIAGMVAMTFVSLAWIFPALMMIVLWRWIGLNHPVPMNLYEPLGPGRRIWAAVALVALIVCVTPTPVWQR